MLQKLNNQSKKLFTAILSRIKSLKTYWGIILPIILIALLILLGRAAYLRWALQRGWADWTGLGSYAVTDEKLQRGKTLWDWLELLIIPFVLAFGAWWLQKSERKVEQDKAKDQQQETALQTYIDRMTELLLDEKHPLRDSKPEDKIRMVARTRTLATLRGLDPARKGMLLKFLYEAELIASRTSENDGDEIEETEMVKHPIIKLNLADLSGANLRDAYLSEANLSEANLSAANLCRADLSEANLNEAFLNVANLSEANLSETFLNGTDLHSANLIGANLGGANLHEAKLSGANLSGALLKNATMPDGKKYDPTIHVIDKHGRYMCKPTQEN